MDLSTIQMHLDNFVDTWNGWNDIINGVSNFLNLFLGGDDAQFGKSIASFEGLSDLSSK